jgi:hypothetical protein
MNFYFKKFRDNVYNPAYYREILNLPLPSGFKYYLKLSVWLVLFYTAFVSVLFVPNMVRLAREITADLAQSWPGDLKIRVQNGAASINLPEPLAIPLPASAGKVFNYSAAKTGRVIGNLLVIDTRTSFSSSDMADSRSLFVLKKDAVAGAADGEIRLSKIPADQNLTIDREAIRSLAEKTGTFISILTPISVLLIYGLGLIFFFLTLLPIMVTALAVWALLLVAARRDSIRLRLAQAVQVTLHAVTLSLVANFFTFLLYPSLAINFPFMLTFSLLVVYANLIRAPKPVFTPPETHPRN